MTKLKESRPGRADLRCAVLAEALGWVECRVVATLPSGDHTLVLGEWSRQASSARGRGFKYSGYRL